MKLSSRQLAFVLFIAVLVLFSSSAPYAKTIYEADGVYWNLLFGDLFSAGGSLWDWKLAPGMNLDLGLVFSFAVSWLTGNNLALNALILTFLESSFLFLSMAFLFEGLSVPPMEDDREGVQVSDFLLFFLTVASMYSSRQIIGFFHYYAPADLGLAFLTTGALLRNFQGKGRRYCFVFLICLLYGALSSERYLGLFAIPLLTSLTALCLVRKSFDRPTSCLLAPMSLVVLFATMAGGRLLVQLYWPNYSQSVAYLNESGLSLSKFSLFGDLLSGLFLGQYGRFHLLLTVALLCCLGTLLLALRGWLRRIRQGLRSGVQKISTAECDDLFLTILVVLIWAATLASLFLLTSPNVHRYYSFALSWLFFWALVRFKRNPCCQQLEGRKIKQFLLLISLGLVISFLLGFEKLKDFSADLASTVSYEASSPDMESAKCIDGQQQKYGLQTGVGEFWAARPVSAMSKKGIWVNQVSGGQEPLPYFWENNKEWYLKGRADQEAPLYNFLIISKRDPDDTLDRVRDQFGKESHWFSCPGTSTISRVLVYSADTGFDGRLRSLWRTSPSTLLFQQGPDEWHFMASDLPREAALQKYIKVHGGRLTTMANQTPQGLLTYGPYLRDLKPGTYEITLTYRLENVVQGIPILQWDILNNMKDIIDRGEIVWTGEGVSSFTYRLTIQKESNLLEFRTFLLNPEAVVTLYSLKFERLWSVVDPTIGISPGPPSHNPLPACDHHNPNTGVYPAVPWSVVWGSGLGNQFPVPHSPPAGPWRGLDIQGRSVR